MKEKPSGISALLISYNKFIPQMFYNIYNFYNFSTYTNFRNVFECTQYSQRQYEIKACSLYFYGQTSKLTENRVLLNWFKAIPHLYYMNRLRVIFELKGGVGPTQFTFLKIITTRKLHRSCNKFYVNCFLSLTM